MSKKRLIDDDLQGSSVKKTKDVERLREIYYTPAYRLGGLTKIWEVAKEEKLGFTQNEIKTFMAKQKGSQVTKEFKKPKKFTTIRAPKAGTNMQMDLMFFDKPKIKGTAGVLNVIDVHSRRAFSERIKNKSADVVLAAFQKIFGQIQKDGKKVRHMNSDEGKELVRCGNSCGTTASSCTFRGKRSLPKTRLLRGSIGQCESWLGSILRMISARGRIW